jgi:hypothetical protein
MSPPQSQRQQDDLDGSSSTCVGEVLDGPQLSRNIGDSRVPLRPNSDVPLPHSDTVWPCYANSRTLEAAHHYVR